MSSGAGPSSCEVAPAPPVDIADRPASPSPDAAPPQARSPHVGGDAHGESSPSTSPSSYSYEYDYDEDRTDSRAGEAEDGSDTLGEAAEDLLHFGSVTLPPELDGHRVMTVQAFPTHLFVGTNQGTIAALRMPHSGTSSSAPSSSASRPQVVHLMRNHEDPISDLSCNTRETYLGSCDKAGNVCVQSLTDRGDVWRRQMEVPLQTLALRPTYEACEDRPLVCAGQDKVLLVTKLPFLSHRRTTVLAEGRGRVARVRWSALGLLAWLTERGLTLYSYDNRAVLRFLPSPVAPVLPPNKGGVPSAARRLELYPATLLWEPAGAGANVLCGWGDWVQQVRVRVASAAHAPTTATAPSPSLAPPSQDPRSPPTYTVESATPHALLPSTMRSPYRVCGLAPFGTDRLLILACIVDGDLAGVGASGATPATALALNAGEGAMRDLEVRVVERDTLEDLYRGRMMVHHAHPLQLALTCRYGQRVVREERVTEGVGPRAALYPPSDTVYFILSADALVRATPCDEDDHVDFLLRNRQYEEAYAYALRHSLRRRTPDEVAQQMLTALLAAGEVDRVVELLPSCLGTSPGEAAAWERWVFAFDQRGLSWKLMNALPTREGSQRRGGAMGSGSGGAAATAATDALNRLRGQARPQPAEGTVMPTVSAIGKEYYDLVLLRALEHDAVSFYTAIQRFEGLYSVDVVAKAAEMRYRECSGLVLAAPTMHAQTVGGEAGKVDEEGSRASETTAALRALTEAYGWLLRIQGRHEESLQVLLKLRDSEELFSLIRRAKLYAKALELLPELFACSAARTVELLLEHAPSPVRANAMDRPSSLSSASVTATGPGSGADPLSPESVLRRLERVDRGYLWTYLAALREHNRPAFAAIAKRHAQLVVTLYIDYDRAQLLSILREMSMYLDRVHEAYALCRKHGLLEEVVFLMARMGKEEEGLRVIVQQMKNMPKAIAYIAEVPTLEDRPALFRSLVQLSVEANAQLPVRTVTTMGDDGQPRPLQQRYTLHHTEVGDTYASIAARYGVDESVVREANARSGCRVGSATSFPSAPGTPPSRSSTQSVSAPSSSLAPGRRGTGPALRQYASSSSLSGGRRESAGGSPLVRSDTHGAGQRLGEPSSASQAPLSPPRPCIVPLHLLSALLLAAAEPAFADNPAIDATYLVRALPPMETIPHVGDYIAAVTRSRAEEVTFMETVLQAAERDLGGDLGRLLRHRSAAIRVDPRARRRGERDGPTPASTGHRMVGSPTSSTAGRASPTAAVVTSMSADKADGQAGLFCGLCGQRVPAALPTLLPSPPVGGEEGEVGGLVAFGCSHVYHPRCVRTYLMADGLVTDGVPVMEWLSCPEPFARGRPALGRLAGAARRHGGPYCREQPMLRSALVLRCASPRRICFLTDVEGDTAYFQRFMRISRCLRWETAPRVGASPTPTPTPGAAPLDLCDAEVFLTQHDIMEQRIRIGFTDDTTHLVYGGDTFDHGPDLSFATALLDLKRRYPTRVHLILGNRDVNKMVLVPQIASVGGLEPAEAERRLFPRYRKADVGYAEFLKREGGSPTDRADPVSYLRWALAHKMGSPNAFEHRRRELAAQQMRRAAMHCSSGPRGEGEDEPLTRARVAAAVESGACRVTDAEVAESFFAAARPGGVYHAHLHAGSLMTALAGILFVHGGVNERNVGFLPDIAADNFQDGGARGRWLEQEGVDALGWAAALEAFRRESLREWTSGTGLCGVALRQYVSPRVIAPYSVTVGSFMELDGPRCVSLNAVAYLLASGLHTVCAGHQPAGDTPALVRQPGGFLMVSADNSYCGQLGPYDSPGNRRGPAVHELIFHVAPGVEVGKDGAAGDGCHGDGGGGELGLVMHGTRADGRPFDFTVDDHPLLGRYLGDGWWVRVPLFRRVTVDGGRAGAGPLEDVESSLTACQPPRVPGSDANVASHYELTRTQDGYRTVEVRTAPAHEVAAMLADYQRHGHEPLPGSLRQVYTPEALAEVRVSRLKTKVTPSQTSTPTSGKDG